MTYYIFRICKKMFTSACKIELEKYFSKKKFFFWKNFEKYFSRSILPALVNFFLQILKYNISCFTRIFPIQKIFKNDDFKPFWRKLIFFYFFMNFIKEILWKKWNTWKWQVNELHMSKKSKFSNNHLYSECPFWNLERYYIFTHQKNFSSTSE